MKASSQFSSIRELYEYTIDYLKGDKATLSNCSLACRSWSPRSRQILFCSIRLDDIVNASRIEDFIETLRHSPPAETPPMGQLIRELALIGSSRPNVEFVPHLGPPVPFSEPAPLLPLSRTYHRTTIKISTLWELINCLSSLSSLSLINLSISFHSLVPPWRSIPVDQRPILQYFFWKLLDCGDSHSCVELLNMFSFVEELSNQNSLSGPMDSLLSTLGHPDVDTLTQKFEVPKHIGVKKLSVSSQIAETTILFMFLPITRCSQSLKVAVIELVDDSTSAAITSHFFSTIGPNLTDLTLQIICVDDNVYFYGHRDLRACIHLQSLRLLVTIPFSLSAVMPCTVNLLDTIASSSISDIVMVIGFPAFPSGLEDSSPEDPVWEQFRLILKRFRNLKTFRFELDILHKSQWLAFAEALEKHLSHFVDAGILSVVYARRS
ncbi:hypothetical protein C8Q75DRAFT_807057 [Abortiporus biennis]|nr:hypothetical protein C8Q75DRAFT_807057 [Abortiporus biennis]